MTTTPTVDYASLGLVDISQGEVALVGSRCTGCDRQYFPRSAYCRNPHCTSGELIEESLGRAGSLYSFTVQRYQPPPPFVMEAWTPYPIGIVALPGGLRVLAILTECEIEELHIGMQLELVARSLDPQMPAPTYMYRPTATTAAST